VRGGFRAGRAHGLFCLGCCSALTLLMVYEKTGRHATTVSRIAGVALLVSAAVMAAGNI